MTLWLRCFCAFVFALGGCVAAEEPECPPVPDAGDLQTLCQELYPAPDAGACPECDDCSGAPTQGVDEAGAVHNLVLGHFVQWAPSSNMKNTDPDDVVIDAMIAEGKRMLCLNRVGDCATIESQMDEMAVAYKAAYALRAEGQSTGSVYLSQLRANPGDERLPAWALESLNTLEAAVNTGDQSQAELLAIIGQIGAGQGKYNGGNLGRVLRSVGKGSLEYWDHYAATNDGFEDDICRHWLLTDIGFSMWSGAVGAAASALDWYLDNRHEL